MLGKLSMQLVNSSFDDLARAEGMVDLLRGFVARSRFGGNALAHGLVRLALTQMSADRCDDALASLDEMDTVCGRARRKPSVDTVIGASFVRAAALAKLGRNDEALAVAMRHVEQARALARRHPRRGEGRLAWALRLLAHCLVAVKRYPEAINAGQRAVRIARTLLARGETVELAGFLVTLSGWLYRTERFAEAAAHAQEAVVLIRRGAAPDPIELAGALVNLGASLRPTRPQPALEATDEAIAIYEDLLDTAPGPYNLERARRNRVLLLRDLGMPAEVVNGPYPLCDGCRGTRGGLVAVRHPQVHISAGGRESCVDAGLADVMAALWEVCDTRECCEDNDGRAFVVPEVGQCALAERTLLELGYDVVNEKGVLYFELL